MSRYYEFKCTNCGWIELRYSNSSRCRHCGMSIIRIEWPTADEQIMELRADIARLRELLGEAAKFDMKVFTSNDKEWLKLLGEWNEITFRVQKELE